MVEPLERPLSLYIHTQFVTADENSYVAEAVKILRNLIISFFGIIYWATKISICLLTFSVTFVIVLEI